jgi:hypothetical protein
VAGDAAVGEEVGRVGEDEVDGGFGDLGEEVEAVALVEAEVVFGVVEGGSWEGVGHDDDRSGSLITTVRVSSWGKSRSKELHREHSGHGEEKTGKGLNAETEGRRRPDPVGVNAGRREERPRFCATFR